MRACTDYATIKGIEVIGAYKDEAISGKGSKTEQRIEYQRMLKDSGKGLFDTILIHKYDRIARSLLEHVNLKDKINRSGVQLIAVAQDFGKSNEAVIMRALMQSMSEYYNLNLAAEVRKGHKENALKALYNGGVAPFGYDVVNKRYVINELEAGFVRKIYDAAVNRRGFVEVLEELNAAGIIGKRGKPLKYTQIYEMLHNEKYTGVYTYSQTEEVSRSDRRHKPNAIKK